MGCCGKIEKIKNIAKGNLSIDRADSGVVSNRLTKCEKCEKATWLTIFDFANIMRKYGVFKVVTELDRLEQMPELPKNKNRFTDQHNLFCAVCKCKLNAKARVKDETCPLGKW